MSSEIDFRLASPADAGSLSGFSCAQQGQRHTRDVEELIREDVASDVAAGIDQLRVVIALHDHLIVGVVAHSFTEIEGLGEVQYVHALGVRPDYQRRLIGTILKQNVLDYAHANHIDNVVSSVHRRNHPMLGLNTALKAVTTPDPDDGDYVLTITASQPLLAGFTDDVNHYGETGPVAAAHGLLDAFNAGNYEEAFELFDSNMQLCRAQAWLWNNRTGLFEDGMGTHEDLLPQLLAGSCPPLLWSSFADTELSQFVDEWHEWLELSASGKLGAASRTRIVGAGYEVVILTDASSGPVLVIEPTKVHALQLTLLHSPTGWRVASFSSVIPTPGWPPTFGE